jgi:transketolase
MRTSFIKTLFEIAAHDRRVTLIVGDLGFGVVTEFADRYPNQFVNAGVSEQNMTGLAAGMAMAGRIVFTYSIANFPTLRCIEQIRNDICYHAANVKIVAVGGGYAYGALGMTHHATEDLAILRSLPGMKVVAPGDPVETRLAVRALVQDPSPCYLRLGRAGEPEIHAGNIDFAVGRAITVLDGLDATLISTGGMLENCVKVARLLEAEGLQVQVISMHTVKPLDERAVIQAGLKTAVVLTVEEHSEVGGLGSAVADVLLRAGYRGIFRKLALPDRFSSVAGDYDYLRTLGGLDVKSIASAVREAVATKMDYTILDGGMVRNTNAAAAD